MNCLMNHSRYLMNRKQHQQQQQQHHWHRHQHRKVQTIVIHDRHKSKSMIVGTSLLFVIQKTIRIVPYQCHHQQQHHNQTLEISKIVNLVRHYVKAESRSYSCHCSPQRTSGRREFFESCHTRFKSRKCEWKSWKWKPESCECQWQCITSFIVNCNFITTTCARLFKYALWTNAGCSSIVEIVALYGWKTTVRIQKLHEVSQTIWLLSARQIWLSGEGIHPKVVRNMFPQNFMCQRTQPSTCQPLDWRNEASIGNKKRHWHICVVGRTHW